MIEVDGAIGEGGGQIIRTCLSLSALLGRPFRISNIRRKRAKPGLRAQHLAAVRAVGEICHARLEGDKIGSDRLSFEPSELRGGDYKFDIGTAGATSLVLQALLVPLLFAGKPSHLSLSGGTHVPISPPFDYLRDVFLPVLANLGVRAEVRIDAYGFYPRGGGQIEADILPVGRRALTPFVFPDRKGFWLVKGVSAVGNLPLTIAERQKQASLLALRRLPVGVDIDTVSVSSPGTGTFVFLKTEGAACLAGFSAIGVRGKRAEVVGTEAAAELLEYYHRQGCVDPHLADQLVLYLSLAEGTSSFVTTELTRHLVTNLSVIKQFLGIDCKVKGEIGAPGRVTIGGIALRR